MKINKKLHDKEAVSAVIGVILMVAITVAIAATVFVYVNGMVSDNPDIVPSVQIMQDKSKNQLQVISVDPISLNWEDFFISWDTSANGYFSPNMAPLNNNDLFPHQSLLAGDFIIFDGPAEVTIRHVPTNTLVGIWVFLGTGGSGVPVPGAITVNVIPSPAAGSIDFNPSSYVNGQEVILTPTANPGYTFDSWSGEGSAGAGDTWVVTASSGLTVTATFTVNPPTVTRVSTSTSGFSGVQAGDLLVVIANHRTGTWTTGSQTASASGYTLQEISDYYGSSSHRRAVAILTRVADGSESGSVSVSWSGSGSNTYATSYQIFRGASTWIKKDSDVTQGDTTYGTTMTIPGTALSGGSTENVLSIGAMVWRDNPGSTSFTNLDGQYGFDYNNCYSKTEYHYGLPVTQTLVTWSTSRLGSGLLVQFECS